MTDTKNPEILDYRNSNGNGWMFYKLDGVLRRVSGDTTPEDDLETVRHVQNFELRDDDVIIVAYPKCGTHWLWEIVTMLRRGKAEYHPNRKEVAMLGMPRFEKAHELPSPRVLNSHQYFRHLPTKLVEKKIKTIHIMRNPKDVCVSFYHHSSRMDPPRGFGGSFSEYVDLFLNGKVTGGSYFDYIKDWQRVERDNPDLPILTLFYEELKRNPVSEIEKIAKFLNLPTTVDLYGKIAEACSFTNLKTADVEQKEYLAKDVETVMKGGRKNMYRKGIVGDWKNWLTVAQNEAFNDVIKKENEDTGIQFIYDLSD